MLSKLSSVNIVSGLSIFNLLCYEHWSLWPRPCDHAHIHLWISLSVVGNQPTVFKLTKLLSFFHDKLLYLNDPNLVYIDCLPPLPTWHWTTVQIMILAKLEHQLQYIPSKAALRLETYWNIAFIWNYKGFTEWHLPEVHFGPRRRSSASPLQK